MYENLYKDLSEMLRKEREEDFKRMQERVLGVMKKDIIKIVTVTLRKVVKPRSDLELKEFISTEVSL